MHKIAFGLGRYKWHDKLDIISFAFDNGIRFFDTAEIYNSEESLSVVACEDLFVSTKFSPDKITYKDIIDSAEKSLFKLKIDSIGIYNAHWPNPDANIEVIYSALYDLKEVGKIKNIGFCNTNLNHLKRICSLGKVDYVQMEFNVFDRWSQDVFNYCFQHDIKCVAYSPLDQGIVCDSKNCKTVLSKMSTKYSADICQIILSWIMSMGIIPIFTSSNKDHIINNMKSIVLELDQDDILIMNSLESNIQHVNVEEIITAEGGHYSWHNIYHSAKEAIENSGNYCPSPVGMAKEFVLDQNIKPIKLNKVGNSKFRLIEGRIRYWAWVLAFGEYSKIPAYIRETKV